MNVVSLKICYVFTLVVVVFDDKMPAWCNAVG